VLGYEQAFTVFRKISQISEYLSEFLVRLDQNAFYNLLNLEISSYESVVEIQLEVLNH
jgi:hypothetical protein